MRFAMRPSLLRGPLAPLLANWLLLAALLVSGSVAPPSLAGADDPARRWKEAWPRTDFSRHAVPLEEIVSGGPPKDGIPPIDDPRFVSAEAAAAWLDANEPVLVFAHGGEARAYPLQILIWHEIVNDTVGGRPVVVTFCPLCNSALVFDRRVAGRLLDFGTTGKLRNSDLVMWDRQTESWWQQLTGEAIVGALTGEQLTFLPAPLVSFATFREGYPQGQVLSRETGHRRDYGANPYAGYDSETNTRPFLFRGRPDERLHPVERVVAIELAGEAKAYPYRALAQVGAVNDTVGGRAIVVFHKDGLRSALGAVAMSMGRDVGVGVAYGRTVGERVLTFARKDGHLVDEQTGTRWDVLGRAVEGPLKGAELEPVVAGNHFAFAWLAFRPDSAIYRAP